MRSSRESGSWFRRCATLSPKSLRPAGSDWAGRWRQSEIESSCADRPEGRFLLMKILVTGGKGAIGGRLMEKLSELGHEPVSYDLVDGQDIFDLAQLEAAVESVDAVYHLAAEANLNCMRDVEGAHRGAVLNVGGTERV